MQKSIYHPSISVLDKTSMYTASYHIWAKAKSIQFSNIIDSMSNAVDGKFSSHSNSFIHPASDSLNEVTLECECCAVAAARREWSV